jgi:hypothetical protein
VLTLAGEAKSYAERLFDFVLIGPLEHDDAREALIVPAQQEGVDFDDDAVEAVINSTRGYRFLAGMALQRLERSYRVEHYPRGRSTWGSNRATKTR